MTSAQTRSFGNMRAPGLLMRAILAMAFLAVIIAPVAMGQSDEIPEQQRVETEFGPSPVPAVVEDEAIFNVDGQTDSETSSTQPPVDSGDRTMNFAYFMMLIIGIILLAGTLGGSVSRLLRDQDDESQEPGQTEEGKRFHWYDGKAIIMGIAAASLIPLFLKTADSNLLLTISNGQPNESFVHMLVLFGFCLLAAMSSQRFLTSMSNRFMQDVDRKTTKMASFVDAASRQIEGTQRQAQKDLQVLDIVDAQLGSDEPDNEPEQVQKAVAAASLNLRSYIFRKVTDYRRLNWNKASLMLRVIPVYRGLLDAEGGEGFHRNFAQLGFALKDSSPPDWPGAEEALSRAINVRDSTGRTGFEYYEFNRGICRAALDNHENPGVASEAEVRASVLQDLKRGSKYDWYATRLEEHPEISTWLERNELSIDSLK